MSMAEEWTDHDECLGEWNVVDNGDVLIMLAMAASCPGPKFATIVGNNSALGTHQIHVTEADHACTVAIRLLYTKLQY